MSLVGPRPCLAYETEYFSPHHYRALPGAGGHHRPVAGDGTRACQLRRGPRDGRRVRPRLVSRSRSVPDPPDADRDAAAAEGDGLMAAREQVAAPRAGRSQRRAGAEDRRCASEWSGWGTGGRTWFATSTSRARQKPPGCAICARQMLEALGRRFPAVRQTHDFDEMLEIRQPRCGRGGHPRLHPSRPGDAGDQGGQARLRREATGVIVGRGHRPDPSGRRARPSAHARPYVPVQPAGQPDSRPDPLRGARRDLFHLDVPSQSRPAPVRRERHLGPRAARFLDPVVLAGRTARARS